MRFMDPHRPIYALTEAARLLKTPPSTLRWWLGGLERDVKVYPPEIRAYPTGASDLTWPEFIETGLLCEYRPHLPLVRLRPLSSRQETSSRLHMPRPRPRRGAQVACQARHSGVERRSRINAVSACSSMNLAM
jgi:hypothetical protein